MRSKYKIVFLGNANVGKTSLITQFVYRQADRDYSPTIGVDYLCTKTMIASKEVKLHLWDTAGQEKYNSMIPNYTRDSFISVIVFDVTNKDSFESINHWIEDLVYTNDIEKKCKLIIVGNKKDKIENLNDINVVTNEKANFYNAQVCFTSAMVHEDLMELENAIYKCVEDDIKNCQNIVDLQGNRESIADLTASRKRCC